MLSDDVKIRKMLSNGEYTKVQNINNIDAQATLASHAKKRSLQAEEDRAAEKVAKRNQRKHENNISEERKNLKKRRNYLQRIADIFRK